MDGLNDNVKNLNWAEATSRAVVVTTSAIPDHPIVFVNAAFSVLTGYSYNEAMGRNCRFLQGSETDSGVVDEIAEALSSGLSIRREILNYRKNGEAFWNDLTLDPIRDADGAITGYIGVQHDATDRRSAENAKREVEQRLHNIISHVPGYVFRRVLKPDGAIEMPFVSNSLNGILGLPEGTIVTGPEFIAHIHPGDRDKFLGDLRQSASNLSTFYEEFRLVAANGAVRWIRSHAPPQSMPNGDVVWDGLAIEITAEKSSETELAFLAFHDPLTGLCNRLNFNNALARAIGLIDERKRMAVFIVDLDTFQEINDALGQSIGDDVLQMIGERLKASAERCQGIVARLGGDEFGIMIPDVSTDEQSIADLCQTICTEISRPLRISEHELVLQACVGVVIFPSDSDKQQAIIPDLAIELLKRADLALHIAKQEGPGAYSVYRPEADERLRNRMILRQSLHRGTEEKQFELHYHPLVALSSGRIVGAEALVRWNHPELGMQRPDMFIPLAEASGAIIPLGAWVIAEAMAQHQAWARAGLAPPPIAINVSSVQLRKPGFIATVEQALAETGADPRNFEFELTEGLIIEPSPEIFHTLSWIKSLGFGVTIDDFGTGYSTFKYLRDFPIDKIKIDQTFVRQLVIGSSDASIIKAMIALSRSLGVKIVAEGIETMMQRDFLRDEGCEIGQGYLFGAPLTAEDFGWLQRSAITLPVT
jgi:diguanylate cyclase (GGDEF)-like protein/PAS domain S-box-containing protein